LLRRDETALYAARSAMMSSPRSRSRWKRARFPGSRSMGEVLARCAGAGETTFRCRCEPRVVSPAPNSDTAGRVVLQRLLLRRPDVWGAHVDSSRAQKGSSGRRRVPGEPDVARCGGRSVGSFKSEHEVRRAKPVADLVESDPRGIVICDTPVGYSAALLRIMMVGGMQW